MLQKGCIYFTEQSPPTTSYLQPVPISPNHLYPPPTTTNQHQEKVNKVHKSKEDYFYNENESRHFKNEYVLCKSVYRLVKYYNALTENTGS